MENRLNARILYLGLHNQLIKVYGNNSIINRKEFFKRFGMHLYIPKQLRHIALKEMELMGLIEKINRDNLKIIRLDLNLEEDCHKIIQLMEKDYCNFKVLTKDL